ncbi:MAG: phosphatase PAP2 family protein [Cyclobacteriaceae bacterium]
MIEWLNHIDQELFIFLNGLHIDFLDGLMLWITNKKSWIPLYLLIIGFIIYQKRWQSIWIFVAIVLVIAGADQLTSSFMKPFFERLRPCHQPLLADAVYNIGKCGGQYGFASGHAANTFGLATILFLTLDKEFGWFKWMFLWAAIVSYSRVYVGVHYPGDILVGAMVGVLIAHLIFQLYSYFQPKFTR